jgi:hypothetical protein
VDQKCAAQVVFDRFCKEEPGFARISELKAVFYEVCRALICPLLAAQNAYSPVFLMNEGTPSLLTARSLATGWEWSTTGQG